MTEAIEQWMERNRSRARITKLEKQLENAQRRGFQKTSIDLQTLEFVLTLVKEAA